LHIPIPGIHCIYCTIHVAYRHIFLSFCFDVYHARFLVSLPFAFELLYSMCTTQAVTVFAFGSSLTGDHVLQVAFLIAIKSVHYRNVLNLWMLIPSSTHQMFFFSQQQSQVSRLEYIPRHRKPSERRCEKMEVSTYQRETRNSKLMIVDCIQSNYTLFWGISIIIKPIPPSHVLTSHHPLAFLSQPN
jgi:hypothetical protein